MISANQLSEEQIGQIRGWAEEGDQLSDIQKRLQEDLGLSATYLDTRFLVLDLAIELKVEEEPEEEIVPPEDVVMDGEDVPAADAPAPVGGLSVILDEVPRPGATVSGAITFSDGEKGVWMIDEMGRPGLETGTPGYQPCEEDMVAFEQELRRLLQG
jgi:hypothetical protein